MVITNPDYNEEICLFVNIEFNCTLFEFLTEKMSYLEVG